MIDLTSLKAEYVNALTKPDVDALAQSYDIEHEALRKIISLEGWEFERRNNVVKSETETRLAKRDALAKAGVNLTTEAERVIAFDMEIIQKDLPFAIQTLISRIPEMGTKELVAVTKLLIDIRGNFLDTVKELVKGEGAEGSGAKALTGATNDLDMASAIQNYIMQQDGRILINEDEDMSERDEILRSLGA